MKKSPQKRAMGVDMIYKHPNYGKSRLERQQQYQWQLSQEGYVNYWSSSPQRSSIGDRDSRIGSEQFQSQLSEQTRQENKDAIPNKEVQGDKQSVESYEKLSYEAQSHEEYSIENINDKNERVVLLECVEQHQVEDVGRQRIEDSKAVKGDDVNQEQAQQISIVQDTTTTTADKHSVDDDFTGNSRGYRQSDLSLTDHQLKSEKEQLQVQDNQTNVDQQLDLNKEAKSTSYNNNIEDSGKYQTEMSSLHEGNREAIDYDERQNYCNDVVNLDESSNRNFQYALSGSPGQENLGWDDWVQLDKNLQSKDDFSFQNNNNLDESFHKNIQPQLKAPQHYKNYRDNSYRNNQHQYNDNKFQNSRTNSQGRNYNYQRNHQQRLYNRDDSQSIYSTQDQKSTYNRNKNFYNYNNNQQSNNNQYVQNFESKEYQQQRSYGPNQYCNFDQKNSQYNQIENTDGYKGNQRNQYYQHRYHGYNDNNYSHQQKDTKFQDNYGRLQYRKRNTQNYVQQNYDRYSNQRYNTQYCGRDNKQMGQSNSYNNQYFSQDMQSQDQQYCNQQYQSQDNFREEGNTELQDQNTYQQRHLPNEQYNEDQDYFSDKQQYSYHNRFGNSQQQMGGYINSNNNNNECRQRQSNKQCYRDNNDSNYESQRYQRYSRQNFTNDVGRQDQKYTGNNIRYNNIQTKNTGFQGEFQSFNKNNDMCSQQGQQPDWNEKGQVQGQEFQYHSQDQDFDLSEADDNTIQADHWGFQPETQCVDKKLDTSQDVDNRNSYLQGGGQGQVQEQEQGQGQEQGWGFSHQVQNQDDSNDSFNVQSGRSQIETGQHKTNIYYNNDSFEQKNRPIEQYDNIQNLQSSSIANDQGNWGFREDGQGQESTHNADEYQQHKQFRSGNYQTNQNKHMNGSTCSQNSKYLHQYDRKYDQQSDNIDYYDNNNQQFQQAQHNSKGQQQKFYQNHNSFQCNNQTGQYKQQYRQNYDHNFDGYAQRNHGDIQKQIYYNQDQYFDTNNNSRENDDYSIRYQSQRNKNQPRQNQKQEKFDNYQQDRQNKRANCQQQYNNQQWYDNQNQQYRNFCYNNNNNYNRYNFRQNSRYHNHHSYDDNYSYGDMHDMCDMHDMDDICHDRSYSDDESQRNHNNNQQRQSQARYPKAKFVKASEVWSQNIENILGQVKVRKQYPLNTKEEVIRAVNVDVFQISVTWRQIYVKFMEINNNLNQLKQLDSPELYNLMCKRFIFNCCEHLVDLPAPNYPFAIATVIGNLSNHHEEVKIQLLSRLFEKVPYLRVGCTDNIDDTDDRLLRKFSYFYGIFLAIPSQKIVSQQVIFDWLFWVCAELKNEVNALIALNGVLSACGYYLRSSNQFDDLLIQLQEVSQNGIKQKQINHNLYVASFVLRGYLDKQLYLTPPQFESKGIQVDQIQTLLLD